MGDKTNDFVNPSNVGSNSNTDKLDRIIELFEETNAMVKPILNSDEKEIVTTETPVVENVTLETPEVPNVVTEEVTPTIEEPIPAPAIEPEVKTEEVVNTEPVVETPALNPVMEQTMQLPQEEIVQPAVETPAVAPEVEVPVVTEPVIQPDIQIETTPIVNEQPVVEEKKQVL